MAVASIVQHGVFRAAWLKAKNTPQKTHHICLNCRIVSASSDNDRDSQQEQHLPLFCRKHQSVLM